MMSKKILKHTIGRRTSSDHTNMSMCCCNLA